MNIQQCDQVGSAFEIFSSGCKIPQPLACVPGSLSQPSSIPLTCDKSAIDFFFVQEMHRMWDTYRCADT